MSIYGYEMVLAIDFDGVLHDHKNKLPGQKMGAPLAGAKEAMETLKRRRNTLIIHSARAVPANIPLIVEWLKLHGIPFDDVTNTKPTADVYLDDKALHFTSWDDCKLLLRG